MEEGPTSVLIAEDDDDDYFIFSVALAESSPKVSLTRAENGQALLDKLERETPDILFLDLHMPKIDGQLCLKAIRANKKFESLPVVVYTSFKDPETIEYCYRERSNLYVMKPDSFADLKTALERILAVDWKDTTFFPSRTEFVYRSS